MGIQAKEPLPRSASALQALLGDANGRVAADARLSYIQQLLPAGTPLKGIRGRAVAAGTSGAWCRHWKFMVSAPDAPEGLHLQVCAWATA